MKCNNCGNENADTAAFCSNCGSALQPAAPVATPTEAPSASPVIAPAEDPTAAQTVSPVASAPVATPAPNPTPVASPTPAVASAPVATPTSTKKSKTPLIIALVIGLIVIICGGIATAIILLTGGKTETYACSKEGEILTSSIAATFKRNKLNKMEYTLILENNNSSSSRSNDYSFSYSGPATITSVSAPDNDDWDYYGYDDNMSTGSSSNSNSNYGSSSNVDSEEMMEALALSLVFASFEQYANDSGVDYYESEGEAISTYSVTIDIDKLASKTKDAIFDDDELKITPEEFQKGYTSQGYTCKKK